MMIESVRGLQWRLAVRQQLLETASGLGRQTLQDIFEVAIRVVAVELRRLDQAHDSGSTLTGAQRSVEEPVRPVVVDITILCRLISVVALETFPLTTMMLK
jgi:hypothetical protein